MKRGYFLVTKELIDSPQWKDIEKELSKHMTIEHRIPMPNGFYEFHGVSPLFKEVIEGAKSNKYDCIFKTINRKPVFSKFIEVDANIKPEKI